MAIDLIGSVSSTQTANASAAALGQDDFLKILLTQLTYQDPLKPLDNQQFIAQMAQFSALEQSRQLNEKIDSLLGAQAATQSFGLIGKVVEYTDAAGSTQQAKVMHVAFKDGQPSLDVFHFVNGQLQTASIVSGVRLSSITQVRNTVSDS